jgi:hypothetical protein
MEFKEILPGAWELIEDVEYKLYQLQVPKNWQQVAQFLATARFKSGRAQYPSVPVGSLDPIVAASFPNIIQTVCNSWKYPGVPWILATETADLSYLPDLIKDWLREEFSECLGDDEVESKLNTLDNEAWHWEKEPTNYSIWHQPETRNPLDIRFQALPDYLAKEFLKNPTICFEGNAQYQLTFYRVVRLGQGSELMSWPPQRVPLIKRKEKKDLEVGEAYISFVISFRLQTVPWRNEPIIYHQLSIRQWIEEPFEKFPYQSVTAYIGDNRRWLDGVDQAFCFIPLLLKQKGREPRWSKAISELLKINDSLLPEPNNLAGEPKYDWSDFGEEPSGIQVAIVYNTHWGKLPCLRGVSPLDLASLDQAIQNKIVQEGFPVRRVGEATKVKLAKRKVAKTEGQKNFWELTGKLRTAMHRPEIVAPSVFRSTDNLPDTILILWETKECRDKLIVEICELLNLLPKGEPQIYKTLPEVQGEEILYESPLGALRIKTQHVQDLTQKLDVENPSVKGKSRQQKRINLLDERIHQITSSLPNTEGKLSGALIEIRPKKSFFPPESDPKLALRIGAMQAGYVNQHIHPLTAQNKKGEEYKIKDAANRVQNAVSDLLRQFGILPTPLIDLQKDGIDSNIWLACFYVLRRTRKTTASNTPSTVALMVRVNPVTGIVQVTTPSLFLTQGWVSYSVGLGYLITEKWEPDSYVDETTSDSSEEQSSKEKKQEQQLLTKFVTDCLRDCLSTPIETEKLPRVLFMVEAYNAREKLTWLQNPKLPANALPDELKRDITKFEQSRLLMVRLRVAKNGEVPVGIVKGSPGSRISKGGVFCWQDVCDDEKAVLYLSIRRLLNPEQGTNTLQKQQSRLDNGHLQAGNPRFLEIAVVHSPEIDLEKLAYFVHNLRNRWPYFADDVSLPFPFPFATLAREYAVSAKDEERFSDSPDSSELA